jgi:hypothetical protein
MSAACQKMLGKDEGKTGFMIQPLFPVRFYPPDLPDSIVHTLHQEIDG